MVEENPVDKSDSEAETETGSELEKTSDMEAVSPSVPSDDAQDKTASEPASDSSDADAVKLNLPTQKYQRNPSSRRQRLRRLVDRMIFVYLGVQSLSMDRQPVC